MMDPIYIFMDLEAAHGYLFFGDIVEIAAQVDPDLLEYEVFESLINTDQSLAFFTVEHCKITKELLKGKPYFPDVFKDFMKWICHACKKCEEIHKKSFYPVLVAHGGFDNDFLMLQSNLERHHMDVNLLSENNLHFGDTYFLARNLKADGEKCLEGSLLSIEAMLKKFFPNKTFKGLHRAMNDVRYMIKIFYETKLKTFFHKLPLATFENRNADYSKRNKKKEDTKELDENIPKGLAKVTHTMTLKRLLRNGYSLKKLEELFESCESHLHFYDKLKDLGIERKGAKAMHSRLNSLGFLCGRNASHNTEDKTMEEEKEEKHNYCQDYNEVEGEEKEEVDCKDTSPRQIARTDSGYESIVSEDFSNELFYSMFSSTFFRPPLIYNYIFGSFKPNEIENVDKEISILFKKLFNESNRHKNTFNDDESCLLADEDWEIDLPSEIKEFSVPLDQGRLAKFISVGMTEENITGKAPIGRIPLHKYFKPTVNDRPEGGIPQPSSKIKRKFKKQRQRMLSREGIEDFKLSACSDNRTFVKNEKGGVFLLP